MPISDVARENHERLFPDHASTLKVTGPELIEYFDNFAFDEGSGHSDATDIVSGRGEEATAGVLELTGGVGVDATLECVGTGQAMETALSIARPGSMVGYVGVTHGVELPVTTSWRDVSSQGGCSTSPRSSTASPRRTPPWTSAAPSSPRCA